MSITLEQVKQSEEITSYIRKADESLSALGFTEHSFAHVGLVSAQASAILKTLGYDDRTCELAAIAGWLHDIGNVINRIDHAQSGAVMAFRILDKMGAAPEETATIITAIGNHDEPRVYCKHDGSLDEGFEIVSHPATLDSHMHSFPWEQMMNAAVSMGYRSHQADRKSTR